MALDHRYFIGAKLLIKIYQNLSLFIRNMADLYQTMASFSFHDNNITFLQSAFHCFNC